MKPGSCYNKKMSIQESTHPARKDAFEAATKALHEMGDVCNARYFVVSNYDEVVRTKKILTQTDMTLGVEVITLPNLIADLWELWGDGRALVTSTQRDLLISQSLEAYLSEASDSQLLYTDGFKKVIAAIVKEGFSSLAITDDLTRAEREIIAVTQNYCRSIQHFHFVEYTEALDVLVKKESLNNCGIVVFDQRLTVLEGRFVSSANKHCLFLVDGYNDEYEGREEELADVQRVLYDPTYHDTVTARGSVRFLLPSGRYSANLLIEQEIENTIQRIQSTQDAPVSIVIATEKPEDLFDHLAPRFSRQDIVVDLETNYAFDDTDFGRAWLSLVSFIAQSDSPDVSLATDYVLSPFSGISVNGAARCDARWRRWRGQTVDEAVIDLVGFADDEIQAAPALVAEGDLRGALSCFHDYISAKTNWGQAYRMHQLGVVEKAIKLLDQVEALDLSIGEYCEACKRSFVRKSICTEQNSLQGPRVSLLTLAQCAHLPMGSADVVFLCDLDAVHFPLKNEITAKDMLFEKLGIYQVDDQLARMRTMFARAFATATHEVVVSRLLFGSDNSENRPSVLFEELVDCYRNDAEALDTGAVADLPMQLLAYARTRGEEKISENIALSGEIKPFDQSISWYSTGNIENQESFDALLGISQVPDDGRRVVSVSDIETFIRCPYTWFLNRRLARDPLDSSLGSRELGTLAHEVFERFHQQFQMHGHRRVTSENTQEAQEAIGALFDVVLDEQAQLPPNRSPIIVVNDIERVEVETLKRNVQQAVVREADLLPGYEPMYHEVSFGYDEECLYAGIPVKGRVDRIDVDASGNAVIIDYKRTVGDKYILSVWEDGTIELPERVQSLIYAQLVKRKLSLRPRAALYLSYTKPQIVGTYDQSAFNPELDLRGINAEKCAVANFETVLDQVENTIEQLLAPLTEGQIDAWPSDEHVCDHCPLTLCTVRDNIAGVINYKVVI